MANGNLSKGFSDMAQMAQNASNSGGDLNSQLANLFGMVDNYQKTNPNETKAMEDYIGARCEHRKNDMMLFS